MIASLAHHGEAGPFASFAVATIWWPDLNPIGEASVMAMVIVATLAATATQRWVPKLAIFSLMSAGPLLLAMAAYLLLATTRFWDLAKFLALFILLASGFGFALASLRREERYLRVYGGIFTYLFGITVMYLWVGGILPSDLEHTRLLAAAITPVAVAWTPLMIWFNRRAVEKHRRRHGLCVQCGYDLRGSVGQPTCPECGAPRQPAPERLVLGRLRVPEAIALGVAGSAVLLQFALLAFWQWHRRSWDPDTSLPLEATAIGMTCVPLICAAVLLAWRRLRPAGR